MPWVLLYRWPIAQTISRCARLASTLSLVQIVREAKPKVNPKPTPEPSPRLQPRSVAGSRCFPTPGLLLPSCGSRAAAAPRRSPLPALGSLHPLPSSTAASAALTSLGLTSAWWSAEINSIRAGSCKWCQWGQGSSHREGGSPGPEPEWPVVTNNTKLGKGTFSCWICEMCFMCKFPWPLLPSPVFQLGCSFQGGLIEGFSCTIPISEEHSSASK